MVDMRRLAVLQKLANAEKMGNADQVKRLKARLKDFPEDEPAAEEETAEVEEAEPVLSMATPKPELIAAATEVGVYSEGMTKAEILEALNGAE